MASVIMLALAQFFRYRLCFSMASRSKRPNGAAEHVASNAHPIALAGRGSCGVSEHPGTTSGRVRQDAWEGTLAFSNIGVRGQQWSKKHRPRRYRLVTELFEASAAHGRRHELLGVLLNDAGNMSDLLDSDCKDKFGDMMSDAFISAAGCEPRILWNPGETMAAFRPEVIPECLPQLVQMNRVDPWRTVDRFAIHGATEHGSCKLVIYNQHQPATTERPFRAAMRIAFFKAVLCDAIGFCTADAQCCGFAFGGDANCSMAPWSNAFQEVSGWNLTFQEPQFLHGVGRKGGDRMVAAAVQGVDMMIYENRCEVQGREKQHDCMLFKWSCRGFPHAEAPAWPSERQVRPRMQDELSSALAEPARGATDTASDNARGTSSASGAALRTDQVEHIEAIEEARILEADDMSSCGSVDYGDAPDEAGGSEHADEAGASEHTEAPGDGGMAKQFNELAAIGFALAKSASLLPDFRQTPDLEIA